MKPQDLVKYSILSLQQRENTDFEDIQHRGSTVKAKVEFGDFRKLQNLVNTTESLDDEISFLDVDITSDIQRGDVIVYDSQEYQVEFFTKAFGLYKLYCIQRDRFGSMRR